MPLPRDLGSSAQVTWILAARWFMGTHHWGKLTMGL